MKKNFLYFFIIICASCSENKKIIGKYSKIGKDFKYNLIINKGNNFLLTEESFEASSKCQGKWYLIKDTLLLECAKEDLPTMLQSGYMSDRLQKAIILDHHQIKLKQVVLMREAN